MLHSHSHQEQSFDYFASFLRNVISGDNRYKALVEPIISEAKSLALKEKDYFAISRSGFEVIVFLAQRAPGYLQGLNPQDLSENDYKQILEMVTAPKEEILA